MKREIMCAQDACVCVMNICILCVVIQVNSVGVLIVCDILTQKHKVAHTSNLCCDHVLLCQNRMSRSFCVVL